MQALNFSAYEVVIPFESSWVKDQRDLESCLIAAGANLSKDFVSQRCAEHCKIIAQREWANLGYRGPFEIVSYDEASATLVRPDCKSKVHE